MVTRLSAPEGERLHEPPAVIDLPVGRAVQVRTLVGAGETSSDGVEPCIDLVRFYVPIAAWETLFVLAFSTPSLPAADTFAELFCLIARTARWKAVE